MTLTTIPQANDGHVLLPYDSMLQWFLALTIFEIPARRRRHRAAGIGWLKTQIMVSDMGIYP